MWGSSDGPGEFQGTKLHISNLDGCITIDDVHVLLIFSPVGWQFTEDIGFLFWSFATARKQIHWCRMLLGEVVMIKPWRASRAGNRRVANKLQVGR
ncbi:unnamed protein product [Urochloa humidicola]